MFVILDSFIDRTNGRNQSFYGKDGLPGVCHIPMEPAFCPETHKVIETSSKGHLKEIELYKIFSF